MGNQKLYKSLFGDKTYDEIQQECVEAMREMANPNHIRYIEVHEDKEYGFSSSKLVVIPSEEAKGKWFYSQWRNYLGNSSYIKQGSKLPYAEWLKKQIKNTVITVLVLACVIGSIVGLLIK